MEEANEKLNQALKIIEKTEELFCRIGRIEKDLGLAQFNKKSWSAAVYHFERAFDYYESAYEIHEGHYPAINMSSIRLHQSIAEHHQGHFAQSAKLSDHSREIATDLLTRRDKWPVNQPSDPLWHLATEAEAYFLTGNHEKAKELYEQASSHPLITASDWKSIDAQRKRNEALIHPE